MKTEHEISLADQFAEASSLLETLRADLRTVEAQIDENLSALSEASAARRGRVEAQAHALLAGQSSAEIDASVEAAQIRADVEAARLKKPALIRAIELQRQVVEHARHKWHQQVCHDLQPKHAELVREIAQRLLELDAVLTAEADLRDAVYQKTGLHHHKPMGLAGFGLLREDWSRPAVYLIEAVQAGYLEKSDLPKYLHGRLPIPAPAAIKPRQAADSDGWLNAASA